MTTKPLPHPDAGLIFPTLTLGEDVWRRVRLYSPGEYENGRIALDLECDDELLAPVTVNMPGYPLADGCVYVSDEHEGLLAQLEDAGVLRATGRKAPAGFREFEEARLLIEVATLREQPIIDKPDPAPEQ
jgi:hypothetical protein